MCIFYVLGWFFSEDRIGDDTALFGEDNKPRTTG